MRALYTLTRASKIVSVVDTLDINPPPSSTSDGGGDGVWERVPPDSPHCHGLANFPERYFRDQPSGELHRRTPVRLIFSATTVRADGVSVLHLRLAGSGVPTDRPVRVNLEGARGARSELTLLPGGPPAEIVTSTPGVLRAAIHPDEFDLVDESSTGSLAVAVAADRRAAPAVV